MGSQHNVIISVDIYLEEHDVIVGLGHLLDLRSDHLARAAPGGKEVDDNLKKELCYSTATCKVLLN